MSSKYEGFQGGNYGRERDARRGLERALAKGPVEQVESRSVFIPEPLETWEKPAKMLWVAATQDEARDYWSSGDWMRLWITCSYYDDMLSGRTRYSAQAMEVVMTTMTELRLSDRAKRQDGIIVVRDDDVDADMEWLEAALSDGLGEIDAR